MNIDVKEEAVYTITKVTIELTRDEARQLRDVFGKEPVRGDVTDKIYWKLEALNLNA